MSKVSCLLVIKQAGTYSHRICRIVNTCPNLLQVKVAILLIHGAEVNLEHKKIKKDNLCRFVCDDDNTSVLQVKSYSGKLLSHHLHEFHRQVNQYLLYSKADTSLFHTLHIKFDTYDFDTAFNLKQQKSMQSITETPVVSNLKSKTRTLSKYEDSESDENELDQPKNTNDTKIILHNHIKTTNLNLGLCSKHESSRHRLTTFYKDIFQSFNSHQVQSKLKTEMKKATSSTPIKQGNVKVEVKVDKVKQYNTNVLKDWFINMNTKKESVQHDLEITDLTDYQTQKDNLLFKMLLSNDLRYARIELGRIKRQFKNKVKKLILQIDSDFTKSWQTYCVEIDEYDNQYNCSQEKVSLMKICVSQVLSQQIVQKSNKSKIIKKSNNFETYISLSENNQIPNKNDDYQTAAYEFEQNLFHVQNNLNTVYFLDPDSSRKVEPFWKSDPNILPINSYLQTNKYKIEYDPEYKLTCSNCGKCGHVVQCQHPYCDQYIHVNPAFEDCYSESTMCRIHQCTVDYPVKQSSMSTMDLLKSDRPISRKIVVISSSDCNSFANIESNHNTLKLDLRDFIIMIYKSHSFRSAQEQKLFKFISKCALVVLHNSKIDKLCFYDCSTRNVHKDITYLPTESLLGKFSITSTSMSKLGHNVFITNNDFVSTKKYTGINIYTIAVLQNIFAVEFALFLSSVKSTIADLDFLIIAKLYKYQAQCLDQNGRKIMFRRFTLQHYANPVCLNVVCQASNCSMKFQRYGRRGCRGKKYFKCLCCAWQLSVAANSNPMVPGI